MNKSEIGRLEGYHQTEKRRENILETAEKLFLQKGIGGINTTDIARAAGITKVTLYRYFGNKYEIATEIQIKMIKKIINVNSSNKQGSPLDETREVVQSMIQNYEEFKDAYQFIGMFDSLYLDNSFDSIQKVKIIDKINREINISNPIKDDLRNPMIREDVIMIASTVIWFLGKVSLREDWATSRGQVSVSLESFERMIMTYLDLLLDKKKRCNLWL